MIKQLTSNTSYFTYLSARYNKLVLIVNIVGIPTCSQHLLTCFVRRPDDGHLRTETCSLTHNKIWCVWRKLFYHFNSYLAQDITKQRTVVNVVTNLPILRKMWRNWRLREKTDVYRKDSEIRIPQQVFSFTSRPEMRFDLATPVWGRKSARTIREQEPLGDCNKFCFIYASIHSVPYRERCVLPLERWISYCCVRT